jgi:hypothetical protein
VDLLVNETTHIYLETDLTTKEQALSKWAVEKEKCRDSKPRTMSWLFWEVCR